MNNSADSDAVDGCAADSPPDANHHTVSRLLVSYVKIACLAHQSVTSAAPTYLSADIQLVSEHGRRHLRSSSYRTLTVPRTHTTFGNRSFAIAGPRVWNSLPVTYYKTGHQIRTVRQHLKTQGLPVAALCDLIIVRCTNTLTYLLI